jgi:hypothetical protein
MEEPTVVFELELALELIPTIVSVTPSIVFVSPTPIPQLVASDWLITATPVSLALISLPLTMVGVSPLMVEPVGMPHTLYTLLKFIWGRDAELPGVKVPGVKLLMSGMPSVFCM